MIKLFKVVVERWWECKSVKLPWGTVWRLLKKLNIGLPYYSTVPFLGIYLKETIIQKDRDFPGAPAVKTLSSQFRELWLIPDGKLDPECHN